VGYERVATFQRNSGHFRQGAQPTDSSLECFLSGLTSLPVERSGALKKKFETEAKEIANANVANIRTEAELAAYRNPRIEAARIKQEHASKNKRKEQFYQHLWLWSGRLARLGFVVGLALLVAFAISNT
jgi:hypothetical protein